MLIAAAVVAATCAAVAGAATKPVVPTFTQQQIAKRPPQHAYVPARVATGYRYVRWTFTGGTLRIWFRNPAQREIVFVAATQRGACTAGREKTFQQAGNKVYWSQVANEEQAWRCGSLP